MPKYIDKTWDTTNAFMACMKGGVFCRLISNPISVTIRPHKTDFENKQICVPVETFESGYSGLT